jgi:Zn finger protein HypA/HybF involved in hydrogenase expression
MNIEDFLALCACGSTDIELCGGDELRIMTMEIERCA